jgi:formate/nitrite transporter FocA (FNT family)
MWARDGNRILVFVIFVKSGHSLLCSWIVISILLLIKKSRWLTRLKFCTYSNNFICSMIYYFKGKERKRKVNLLYKLHNFFILKIVILDFTHSLTHLFYTLPLLSPILWSTVFISQRGFLELERHPPNFCLIWFYGYENL